MQRLGYRLLASAAGFLVGCLTLLILYYLLQFLMDLFEVRRVRFRVPILLFALPLITAFVGFKTGPYIFDYAQNRLGDAGPLTRLLIVGPVFWAVVVVAYVFVFEPFGYRPSNNEWLFVAKIVLFPTAVVWSGAVIAAKFIIRR